MAEGPAAPVSKWSTLWLVLAGLALGGIALGMFFSSSIGGFAQAAQEAHMRKDAIMFLKYLFHEVGIWLAMAIAFIAIMKYFFFNKSG